MTQSGMSDDTDGQLIIEFSNKEAVEVLDFGSSLRALARAYERFAVRSDIDRWQKAKLCVDEISTGSIKLKLRPLAMIAGYLLVNQPEAIGNTVNALAFAEYLKQAYDYFSSADSLSETPAKYSIKELSDLRDILHLTSKDLTGREINIFASERSTVVVNITINNVQAHIIQGRIEREIRK